MPVVELSQRVRFYGVHSLHRDVLEDKAAASARVHGHDYEAEVCVRLPVGRDGMAMDQTHLHDLLRDVVSRFEGINLDELEGLGPATTENMAVHVWTQLQPRLPGLLWVAIGREAHGDRVVYRGE